MLSLRTLVLSSAALCSTAAFAANQARVDVPFNFVVKNHTYQAGTYRVEVEPERSLVTLSKVTDPVKSMMWLVGPGNNDTYPPAYPPKVRLTFDNMGQGQDMVLRTVQYGGLTTPNLDAHPKHKVTATRIVGE
jgi:hypothetical protein